jgi:hypothetical protein
VVLNERRVTSVDVVRHTMVVVLHIQVHTVGLDGKLDGPAVTVEFPYQVVRIDTATLLRIPAESLHPIE